MKFPKPWFRPSRGLWFVTIHGKQINLGTDKEAAFYKYKALLTSPAEQTPPPSDCVLAVVEKYLDWCQDHRSAGTYAWYQWRLQYFAKSVERSLTVAQLKPFHIDQCMQKHWSGSFRHGVARAVQRVFRWAERKGYIDKNPVAYYEKARPGRRNVVVAPTQFETLITLAGSDQFRDLMLFTWETAARPQESLVMEARHVDLQTARVVFPENEAKGEQFPRVIYLTETAVGIVRRLMLKNPDGPLFRNCEGDPWTTYAVNCAFVRLQIRLGLQKMKELGSAIPSLPKLDRRKLAALSADERKTVQGERADLIRERRKQIVKLASKHGKKYCLYHLRHSWLDRALKNNVDVLTCAILMGNRDPSTLAKVYQHLSQSPEYLRSAAKKATA